MYKDFRAAYRLITDKSLDDDEVKLFTILELVHDNKITLDKAYELCTQEGLFTSDWKEVMKRKSETWEKYY